LLRCHLPCCLLPGCLLHAADARGRGLGERAPGVSARFSSSFGLHFSRGCRICCPPVASLGVCCASVAPAGSAPPSASLACFLAACCASASLASRRKRLADAPATIFERIFGLASAASTIILALAAFFVCRVCGCALCLRRACRHLMLLPAARVADARVRGLGGARCSFGAFFRACVLAAFLGELSDWSSACCAARGLLRVCCSFLVWRLHLLRPSALWLPAARRRRWQGGYEAVGCGGARFGAFSAGCHRHHWSGAHGTISGGRDDMESQEEMAEAQGGRGREKRREARREEARRGEKRREEARFRRFLAAMYFSAIALIY